MSITSSAFEATFGFSIPPLLQHFLERHSLGKSFPKTFRPRNVGFIVEIQYLLKIDDPRNWNAEKQQLDFAVNSDGVTVVLDLRNARLDLLHNDGDLGIDPIGVSLGDLLESEDDPEAWEISRSTV